MKIQWCENNGIGNGVIWEILNAKCGWLTKKMAEAMASPDGGRKLIGYSEMKAVVGYQ